MFDYLYLDHLYANLIKFSYHFVIDNICTSADYDVFSTGVCFLATLEVQDRRLLLTFSKFCVGPVFTIVFIFYIFYYTQVCKLYNSIKILCLMAKTNNCECDLLFIDCYCTELRNLLLYARLVSCISCFSSSKKNIKECLLEKLCFTLFDRIMTLCLLQNKIFIRNHPVIWNVIFGVSGTHFKN